MILEQLTLRNFCLFRGEQKFNLAPRARRTVEAASARENNTASKNGTSANTSSNATARGAWRPIVLFGGVNGAGKTTLLDAVQLALYGARARCSKRANLPYDEFLRQSIHHGVSPATGASVSLSFRYVLEGEEHLYEASRTWFVPDKGLVPDKGSASDKELMPDGQASKGQAEGQAQGGKIRETFRVYKDGLPDRFLSDNWVQVVEDLIPLGLSQLFFFDAEKIRSLAEDETAAETLGAAVKTLLGLDLAERLIADATALEMRLARQASHRAAESPIEPLELELRVLESRLAVLLTDRTALENHRLRAVDELRQAEEAFSRAGGKHWQDREARLRASGELESRRRELESRLEALAATELPLAMLGGLLERAGEQARLERQAADGEVVAKLLVERDRKVVELAAEAGASARLVRKLEAALAADRADRKVHDVPRRLALSDQGQRLLDHLTSRRLAELQSEARHALDSLAQACHEQEMLERAQAATPDDAQVAPLTERFKHAAGELHSLTEQAKRLDEQLESGGQARKALEGRVQGLLQAGLKHGFAEEDVRRKAGLAARTRQTMQEFLRRATESKIDHLSDLVSESFRHLLHKTSLVRRIVIDPETFAITLYDGGGHAIAKERLSEGEKQIFAVSVLWGLARAAARPLPAIIDTPMARLDATHRNHLVRRYFPQASHQVIILSTDTEVDREYYELLRPYVARAYHLHYLQETRETVGEEGYFWKELAEAGTQE